MPVVWEQYEYRREIGISPHTRLIYSNYQSILLLSAYHNNTYNRVAVPVKSQMMVAITLIKIKKEVIKMRV